MFAELAPDGKDHVGSKMGLTALLRMMWPDDHVDERDGRFINDRVHANIQRDGTFSVVPRMSGGVTSPDQLRRIADVADKHEIPMVKLTGGQRIDLLGVPKEKLQEVWADLDMPSGWAYGKSFRTVKTCVGTDFCRFGLGDSTRLGIDMEERYKGVEGPAKMKLAVSGCPRNCAESMVKDVGLVAVEGGQWQIYVGGAAGATIRKGDILATVDSHDEALRITGRFLQYYRENANWLERTYDFVPRMGLDHLIGVVVDDVEGIADELDARMQETVDRYADPWATDRTEATPGQFHDALPLVPLPQVPIRTSSSPGRGVVVSSTEEAVEARLGPVDRIPLGEGRAFLVGDEPVAVFRPRSGGLHALRAICPHRGGPLADGLIGSDAGEGKVVMCPLHNHQFSLVDGSCATGADDVAAYTATEEDGELVVRLG